jgi:hypothetical protein
LNGHLFGGPTYSGQSANNFLDILHTYTFSGGTLGSNTIIANYNPNYTNVEVFPNANIHSYGGVATNEKISGIKANAFASLCGNFSLYTDDIGQITLVSSNTSPSSITCPVIYIAFDTNGNYDIDFFSVQTGMSCFIKDTPITLCDNTTKLIQDVTYNDELLI